MRDAASNLVPFQTAENPRTFPDFDLAEKPLAKSAEPVSSHLVLPFTSPIDRANGSSTATEHVLCDEDPPSNDTGEPRPEALPRPRVVPLHVPSLHAESRFQTLQSWEGYVLSIQDDTFTARLVDKSGQSPDEEAVIPLSEITPDDEALVGEGAVFYWTIGYSTDLTKARRRVSEMRFRRLPIWTVRELENAAQRAERTIKTLGWE